MHTILRPQIWAFFFFALAACSVSPEKRAPATSFEVAELATAIQQLSPDVDPGEARRAAEIAYGYTRELAIAYRITDPPLVHNTKVNMGLKPRGLCWHWAEDMEARLDAEGFVTLEMHRAIANHDNLLIDHSTAVIHVKGEDWDDGIILDPWRKGGILTWMTVDVDTRYNWTDRDIVLEGRRQQMIAEGLLPAAT
jgi:hypothetical protein